MSGAAPATPISPTPLIQADLVSEIGRTRPTTIDRTFTRVLSQLVSEGLDTECDGPPYIHTDYDLTNSPALLALNIKLDTDPKVRDFDDLIAFYAACDSLDDLTDFCTPKKYSERLGFVSSELARCLHGTRGLLLFRDQALSILQTTGGLELNQATEVLRRLEARLPSPAAQRAFCAGAMQGEHKLDEAQALRTWSFLTEAAPRLRDRTASKASARWHVDLDEIGLRYPSKLCAALFHSSLIKTLGARHALRVSDALGVQVLPPQISFFRQDALAIGPHSVSLGLSSLLALDSVDIESLRNHRNLLSLDSIEAFVSSVRDHRVLWDGTLIELARAGALEDLGDARVEIFKHLPADFADAYPARSPRISAAGEKVIDEIETLGLSLTYNLDATESLVTERHPRTMPRVCGVVSAISVPWDPRVDVYRFKLVTAQGSQTVLANAALVDQTWPKPQEQKYLDAIGQLVERPGGGWTLHALELRVEPANSLVRRGTNHHQEGRWSNCA